MNDQFLVELQELLRRHGVQLSSECDWSLTGRSWIEVRDNDGQVIGWLESVSECDLVRREEPSDDNWGR